MDETPKYRMRFVGFDRHGELKRGAPGIFKRNEVRELTIEYAQDPWWELIDAIPDLVIPETQYKDSVFVEETFVPVEAVDIAPPGEGEDASLHVAEDPGEGVTEPSEEERERLILPIEVAAEDVEVIDYDAMTVPTLKQFIEQRGGEVERGWLKPDLIEKAKELEDASRAASESS